MGSFTQLEIAMYLNRTKSLFAAAAIVGTVFALGNAHAANGARDPYTDGARTAPANVFTDGARIAGLDRTGVSSDPARRIDPYTDGARTAPVNVFTDGARIAGLDRTGVSSDPARRIDPYTDGARTA
jgi:hypothetical protein